MGIILTAALLVASSSFAIVNNFPYYESFESGFGAWTDDASNDFDWSRNTGQTPSSGTGPLGAYDREWYIFTEASGNNPDYTAALDAAFDFGALTKPEMTFYYHMYGNSMGNLHIDVYTGSWAMSVWSLTGEQQTWVTDSWRKATVDLSGYAGASNVILRIRGVTGPSYTSDMCVDKVQIYDNVPRVDIEPIYSTGSGLPGANVNYSIKVINKTTGSSDFNISYFNDPWATLGPVTTGVLPNNDSTDLIIQVQIPSGTYAGDQATSIVQVVSIDNVYTGMAEIVTKCTWTTYPLPCETWDIFPHGWTNYQFASTVFSWLQSGIGNPAPGLYHPAYTAVFTNWFVSPAINLDDPFAEELRLMFDEFVIIQDGYGYTGVLISDGDRNPASNDFVELLEIGRDNLNWKTREIDLAAYRGMNPVYLAFLYIGSNTHLQFIDNVCIGGKKYGIDNSFFVSPTSAVIECSQTAPTFVGHLYIDGETGPAGPASHISAQMGIGPVGSLPTDNADWIWHPAVYTGPDGIYDVFGVSPNIDVVGEFDTAYRYQVGDAGWVYADLNGSSNGYDSAYAGKLTVTPQTIPGSVIYEQTMDGFVWYSSVEYSNAAPAASALSADDISLPVDTTISGIRWHGVYDTSDSFRGDVLGFNINIYANDGSNGVAIFDHPGAPVRSEFHPGLACEALWTNVYGINHYLYQLELNTPFNTGPGHYWISVQIVTDNNDFKWYILNTEDVVKGSPALQYFNGAWYEMISDFGFQLLGNYNNYGVISGAVTAVHSGEPIYPATIQADGSSNLFAGTEKDGTYFMRVPLDTYDVNAAARNYITGSVSGVSLTTVGQTSVQDFSLVGSLLTYSPPEIEEILQVGEVVTNTVTVTNSGPIDVNYRLGVTDFSVSTSGYSMMSLSMPVSPVHIPAFKGEIERGDEPHSIGLPPADFMKNNSPPLKGVPVKAGDVINEFVDKNHPTLKRTPPRGNTRDVPPKTGGELSTISLRSMAATFSTGSLRSPAATFYSPISCAGSAPAYGTEARSGDDRLVSFCTGTPGIITNIGVYTTDDDLIWASDFMPDDLNTLYAINDQNKFLLIDVTNVNITVLGMSVPSPGLSWTGMAIDPDGTIYANATDIDRSELYTIDKTDGTATLIGEIDNSPGSIAIAINANGKMYGHDIVNDSLISINKKTGAGTIIGSLGYNANFGQGMDFDYESGILYLAAYNQNTGPELRIADLTTGNTTNVGALAINQMGSMAVATTNPPSWVSLPTNMGSIAAGGASTFDVIFDSNIVSNKGVYNAEISFYGNFVNDVPNLPLTMNIADGPMLSAPSEINFGPVCVNVTSNIQFTVKNAGFGVITGQLQNVAAPFTVLGDPNYILPSLESVDYVASLTPPMGPGFFTNIITLTGAGSNTVMLTGSAAPTLKTIPDVVRFSDTWIDETNVQVIVYENIGGGVAAGSVTGDSLPFFIDGNTTYSLATYEESYFFVHFAPTSMEPYSTTLTLSGGGDTKIKVTGNGIPEPMGIWIIGLLVPLIKGGVRKGGGF